MGPEGSFKKIILQVTNLQNYGRTLTSTECADGLLSEVYNCGSGSQSDKWGWRFR